MTQAVESRAASTLDAVARTVQARRNLTLLYREMLTELTAEPSVRLCLDAALWLSDQGEVDAQLLRSYALIAIGNVSAEVEYESAITQLCEFGLLRYEEGDVVWNDKFVFHSLTWQLLCELRGDQSTAVLRAFLAMLDLEKVNDSGAPDWGAGSVSRQEFARRVLREELFVAREIGAQAKYADWGMAIMIGEGTSLHVGPHRAGEPPPVRLLEVTTFGDIYEVKAGVRRELGGPECLLLYEFFAEYQASVARRYESVDFDALTSREPDG
jgi:hypothetical protein